LSQALAAAHHLFDQVESASFVVVVAAAVVSTSVGNLHTDNFSLALWCKRKPEALVPRKILPNSESENKSEN